MERVVATDSGAAITAKRSGHIAAIDAFRIVVKVDEDQKTDDEFDVGVDIYKLIKHRKSNQGTSINQKSLAKIGQRVEIGQVIADGPGTHGGELALGKKHCCRVYAVGRIQL